MDKGFYEKGIMKLDSCWKQASTQGPYFSNVTSGYPSQSDSR
uniref:Putative LOC101460606 [Ceratitis capitata] n=1 Tax=Lepeophtheirus salmonis TaxID=72036 RepID=A0A0K2SWC1_LEPSM